MKLQDLNDVRTFVVIAECGTLSGAAKKLGVPPSTVSRSLTRMEKDLDTLLMRRGSKGLTLTDPGQEYLKACKQALRTLKEGTEVLAGQRSQPKGLLVIGCPVTMARDLLAPLLAEFLDEFPNIQVKIEPYCSSFDQEPREDVDIFFKLRAPKDSMRRVRLYPNTPRGLFASVGYVKKQGAPAKPEDLVKHRCIGMGSWKLQRGMVTSTQSLPFSVVSSDPHIHLTMGLQGFGICLLPLWMANRTGVREKLVPILPQWKLEPLTLCAIFSGQSHLTPKIKVFLDFLTERIGTDRDPRFQNSGRGRRRSFGQIES